MRSILDSHSSSVCAVAWLFLAFFLSGCGSSGPQFSSVEGTVTLDGKPLPHAQVVFQPTGETKEKGGPSQATTDENGYYDLQYTLNQSGALVGKHIVSIKTGGITYDENDNEVKNPEKVPARYNVYADGTKEMNVEVESGGNTLDFELTSDGDIVELKDGEVDPNSGAGDGGCVY